MRRIIAQARKDLTQLLRDRLALALALALPVVLTALLGTSISLTVTDIPLVIQDLDQTPLSRRYADAYRSSLTFRIVGLPAATSPETVIATGQARGALIVPEHFEREIRRGRVAEAQLLVDGTDTNTALLVRGGRRAGHARLRPAAARRRRRAGDPDRHATLVQSRAGAAEVLRPRHARPGPVDLPDGARRPQHVARG